MHHSLHRSLSLIPIVAVTAFACSNTDLAGSTSVGGSAASGASTNGDTATTTVGGSSVGGASSGDPSKGGALPSGGTASGPKSCDVKPIMETSCSGIICHGAPGKPAKYNTDFFNPPSGQTLEQMFIGKAANYTLVADPSACPTDRPEQLVNPTSPSESLILKKIKGTQACGVKMPSTKTTLSQEQIDCFVDWVNGMTGNSAKGGSSSGGSSSGAAGALGGTSSTGATSGGASSGGASSGGASSGGASSGGAGKGGASTGGASTGSSASGIPPTFATVKTILTENVTSCVGSDCHGGHQGRLNLLVNDGLLGRLTSSASKLCGMPIVDPGRPSNSAIVKVLREGCGNVAPNCLVGTACIPRMPIGCTEGLDCIPESYIKALEQWITDGAKQ